MSDAIDTYIAAFPPATQAALQRIRETLHAVLPGASETISYKIPALVLDGTHRIYFAGWKHHVSLYPLPRGSAALDRAMAPYAASKGTLKFPLDAPIPYALIARIGKAHRRASRNQTSA